MAPLDDRISVSSGPLFWTFAPTLPHLNGMNSLPWTGGQSPCCAYSCAADPRGPAPLSGVPCVILSQSA